MIPISVIIVTKNEAQNIISCLECLKSFDNIWVVDSESRDKTVELVTGKNVHVIPYKWNAQYPKKRQWCLENLPLKYDWVFFVDADEVIAAELIDEIKTLILSEPPEAGFFIQGRYRLHEKLLRFGLPNQKIVLLHKGRMEFPVVDDLDIPGMGEIEGHYQPVLKKDVAGIGIGKLSYYMIHNALKDAPAERSWLFRHEKYARWEAGMNIKHAWPKDPVAWREIAKRFLRSSKLRPHIIFIIGFFFKLGFLDGAEGFKIAKLRYGYQKKILTLTDDLS